MSAMQRVLFACLAVLLSTLLIIVLLFGVDLYLHKKFEHSAGLNIRGYRGPVVKRKQPGERRIVVLGGSTAFGYGVGWPESFPAQLERKLDDQRRAEGRGPVSVVDLAYNIQGAYSFLFTLQDYARLDYDIALLYTGHNDLGTTPNTTVFRHGSSIFQLTGYYPIFPVIFSEKAIALRYGGNLEAAYRQKKTVFKPNLAQQALAAALDAALNIDRSLERQLGPADGTTDRGATVEAGGMRRALGVLL